MKDTEFVVEKIRSQYTEQEHTELDALKALDIKVKKPATVFGYTYGSLGAIVMGAGMSLVMTDIGSILGLTKTLVPGIAIGIVGMGMVLSAYPIYKKILTSRKKKYAAKIIELSDRLMKVKVENMIDNRYYLLTGAAGFLGSNICAQLLAEGKKVRALVLPGDKSVKFIPKEVEMVLGDLCDEASLEPFFTVPEGCTSVIIHCASMVTVDPGYSEKLMAVNVGGTRNIISKVLAHPECEKMVYVSSTGAIPERPHGTPITEVSQFTPCDPEKVVGAYSLSKATATQMVLDSVRVMGLKACVVHPSGILGPNDHALGETTRTVLQIIKGEMPMGMQGSFNLCDVRDLAAGTIAAIDKGRVGECYILANEPVTLKEMCQMIQQECTAKKISIYLPLGLADKIAQMLEKQAEKTGKKPLMTTFSVYNLARNNVFDYSKAQRELGYTTRSYQETIHDEVRWMIEEGLIDGNPIPTEVTQRELVDSGIVPEVMHAMEHDIDPSAAYEAAKDAYKAIENGVVGAYKAVEKGAVNAYRKVEDTMVDKLFRKNGETIEQTKERLRK